MPDRGSRAERTTVAGGRVARAEPRTVTFIDLRLAPPLARALPDGVGPAHAVALRVLRRRRRRSSSPSSRSSSRSPDRRSSRSSRGYRPAARRRSWAACSSLDNFAIFFKLLMLVSIVLTMLASVRFVGSAPYPGGEYYALLLFTGVGMLFMVSGNNLISIYVALELMALSTYILAGYFKGEIKCDRGGDEVLHPRARSRSGVLLYGLSLVYGVAAEDGPPGARASSSRRPERSNLLMLGILLILGRACSSRSRPSRSTSGRPTSTRARPRRSPRSSRSAPRSRRTRSSRASSTSAFPKFHADWGLIVALVAARR